MSHKTRDVGLGNPVGLPFLPSDEARFWAKVRRAGDVDCWLWTAGVFRNGYGQFRIQLPGAEGKQKTVLAHRVAFQLSHGSIPVGAHILHSCDNRRCVNPAHLFDGDHTANMRDAAAKGRLAVPHQNAQAVSDADVRTILSLVASGAKQCDVAKRYGVTPSHISQLVNGKQRGRLQSKRKAA